MRGFLALTTVLVQFSVPAISADPPAPPPAPPPAGPASGELLEYEPSDAERLVYLAYQVSEQYVRPVSMDELVFTALSALYESARMPVPGKLRAEVRAASAASDSVRSPTGKVIPGPQK